jgi:hypothetical protein
MDVFSEISFSGFGSGQGEAGLQLTSETCQTIANNSACHPTGILYQLNRRPTCADFHRTKETAAQEIPP